MTYTLRARRHVPARSLTLAQHEQLVQPGQTVTLHNFDAGKAERLQALLEQLGVAGDYVLTAVPERQAPVLVLPIRLRDSDLVEVAAEPRTIDRATELEAPDAWPKLRELVPWFQTLTMRELLDEAAVTALDLPGEVHDLRRRADLHDAIENHLAGRP